jgi:energy-coupling factor transporter transmembrane protein EcfT
MVPVFMDALRRADHMAMTLDARGFQSRIRRTVLEPYAVGWLDVVVAAAVLAGVAAYLALWSAGVLQVRSQP